MIQITAVHLEGGSGHQHVARLRWKEIEKKDAGEMSRAEAVKWLQAGNAALVCGANALTRVGVVDASPPYLRTYADGVWNDNLLALPKS